MTAPVLTRWPIVIELSAEPWPEEAWGREACGRWFAEGRRVYFEHCRSDYLSSIRDI